MADIQLLRIASIARIVLTIIILYVIKAPPYVKVILIIMTDFIDCSMIHHILNIYKNKQFCKIQVYQMTDKITDILSYILMFNYIYQNNLLNSTELYFIFGLLLFRILGTGLYLKTQNEKLLLYFPNFYLEITLLLLFIKKFNRFQQYKSELLICVSLIKIYQEYYLHYKVR